MARSRKPSQSETPPNEYLTTAEAAQLLRCQPQTLRRHRCEGRGPRYIKIAGNRVLYSRSVIEEFLQQREYESTHDESAASALRRVSVA
jgi:hypothetical protein